MFVEFVVKKKKTNRNTRNVCMNTHVTFTDHDPIRLRFLNIGNEGVNSGRLKIRTVTFVYQFKRLSYSFHVATSSLPRLTWTIKLSTPPYGKIYAVNIMIPYLILIQFL